MRRIVVLAVLALSLAIFTGSPAEALPNSLFFSITPDNPFTGHTNPGSISYAGGAAPLVGSNIDVFGIVREVAVGGPDDLGCLRCRLSFSTGTFAGTIPAGAGPAGYEGYSFSGGGSLQILGGVNFPDASSFLPEGTVLLTGVPTYGVLSENVIGGTELALFFQGALNPELLSFYDYPAGASYAGFIRINTAEVGNAPGAFTLTTIQTLFGSGGSDVSHVFVQAVPLPASHWPFAIGLVVLAAWRERLQQLK